jgi:hypothetical protein
MAMVQVYVFETAQAAETGKPTGDGSDRFRLYEVTAPDGRTTFVWERNPTVATGRAAESWGMTATPLGQAKLPKTADALSSMLALLPEAERAKFLAQFAAPPAKRKAKAKEQEYVDVPVHEENLVGGV